MEKLQKSSKYRLFTHLRVCRQPGAKFEQYNIHQFAAFGEGGFMVWNSLHEEYNHLVLSMERNL